MCRYRSARRTRWSRGESAKDRCVEMRHRRSTRRIRARFCFPNVPGRRDLREPVFARHEHRSSTHCEMHGRDRARREGECNRTRRHREGERSSPFRANRSGACARAASHRAVARRTFPQTISRARRNDCLRQSESNSRRSERGKTVLDGSQSSSHQLRKRRAGRHVVRRKLTRNAQHVQIERCPGRRAG